MASEGRKDSVNTRLRRVPSSVEHTLHDSKLNKDAKHTSGIEELINWHHRQEAVAEVTQHFVFLAFDDMELEEEFEEKFYERESKSIKIMALWMGAVVALLGIADVAYHKNKKEDSILSLQESLVIRYGGMLPLTVLYVCFAFTKVFRKHQQKLSAVFNVVIGCGLSILAIMGGSYAGYGTIFVFIFYVYFLSKVRFFFASVCSVLMTAFHGVMLYLLSEDDLEEAVSTFTQTEWNRIVVNDTGLLCLLTACCMYASYMWENTMRKEFLNSVIIELEGGKMEHLLHNLLPATAVKALRSGTQVIADEFPVATVLFSDIVGFTKLSGDKHPSEICVLLHNLYSVFDRLTDIYGVYKVETIGDAYEAVSGLDLRSKVGDKRSMLTEKEMSLKATINAASIVNFGLTVLEQLPIINGSNNYPVNIRIGVHSGPVIAGVLGRKMPRYHLWGETVAIAEQLEAQGVAGAMQVSSYSKELLQEYFILQKRGWIQIKGEKAKMETHLLIGPREGTNNQISDQIEQAKSALQGMIQERIVQQNSAEDLNPSSKKKSLHHKRAKRASLPIFGSGAADFQANTTMEKTKTLINELEEQNKLGVDTDRKRGVTSIKSDQRKFLKTDMKEKAKDNVHADTVQALRKFVRRRTTTFKAGTLNSVKQAVQQWEEDDEPYKPMLDSIVETGPQLDALDGRISFLPRGGIMVHTALGNVQFGIPPETIKDAMNMEFADGAQDIRSKMPVCYVIPHQLFDQKCGICMAEVEFPTYFNFFVLGRKPTFLTYPSVERRLRKVLRETLVGPTAIDQDSQYSPKYPMEKRSDILKECAFIRTFNDPDELMEFIHFKDDRSIDLTSALVEKLQASGSKDVNTDVKVIIKDEGTFFSVLENDTKIATIPAKIATESRVLANILESKNLDESKLMESKKKLFEPPMFGVTILGSSHGFDPKRPTTGFVLWMNRRGIMVDPPLHSVTLLESYGIPARLIDAVMVTHCHADHDGGTLQKILAETQCTVISTSAILNSFIRKYSLLTNLEEEFLNTLFIARPAVVGEPVNINGGEIHVFYSMHTIPAIGIVAKFAGKSIYYSGDTCYDIELIEKMHEAGVMTTERKQDLLEQEWSHDLILHECGVPPIHTPVKQLSSFPEEVKKRLWLVHIAEKDVPTDQGLKLALEGVENTLELEMESSVFGDALEVLEMLEVIPFFKGVFMTGANAREILQHANNKKFKMGDVICEEGDQIEDFHIIKMGICKISSDGGKIETKSYSGDYFGESCLLPGFLSNVTISAWTDIETVSFSGEELRQLISQQPDVEEKVTQMLEMQAFGFLDTLLSNKMFKDLTSVQKTNFMAIAERLELSQGQTLWTSGDPAKYCCLLFSAIIELVVQVESTENLQFGVGSIVGDMNALLSNGKCVTEARCIKKGLAFKVSREKFQKFIAVNPGLRMWCTNKIFIESVHSLNRKVSRRASVTLGPEESLLDMAMFSDVKNDTPVIGNVVSRRESDKEAGENEGADNDGSETFQSPFSVVDSSDAFPVDYGIPQIVEEVDIGSGTYDPNSNDSEVDEEDSTEAFPGTDGREAFPGMMKSPSMKVREKKKRRNQKNRNYRAKTASVFGAVSQGLRAKFTKFIGKRNSIVEFHKATTQRKQKLKDKNSTTASIGRAEKKALGSQYSAHGGGIVQAMQPGQGVGEAFTTAVHTILNKMFKGNSSWAENSLEQSLAECMVEGVVLSSTQIHKYTLTFDYRKAETLFQERLSNELPWRRWNLLMLALLTALSGVADFLIRTKANMTTLALLRYGIMLPVAMLWLAFTYTRLYQKPDMFASITGVIALCYGITLSLISVVGKEPGYGGMLLFLFFCGFFVRLRTIHAAPLLYTMSALHVLIVGYFTLSTDTVEPWVRYNDSDLLWALGYLLVFSTLVNQVLYHMEFVTRQDFISELCQKLERQKSRIVLNNMLPQSVAKELYAATHFPLCHEFSTVTMVFCCIDNFETSLAKHLNAVEVVQLLNTMFLIFDILVDKYSLYKVETVGDMYLAASGIPNARHNHAQHVANFVSQLLYCDTNEWLPYGKKDLELKLRFGINSGPVVAGIIGVHRPFYHVFGDTVNTASRMTTTCLPEKCQMTEATFHLLRGKDYIIEERGLMDIKGKGKMRTYFLQGKKGDVEDDASGGQLGSRKRRSLLRVFAEEETESVDDPVQKVRKSRAFSLFQGKQPNNTE